MMKCSTDVIRSFFNISLRLKSDMSNTLVYDQILNNLLTNHIVISHSCASFTLEYGVN